MKILGPLLTSKKINILTQEKIVDIGSRIEILQTLMGYKWVGEAAHDEGVEEPNITLAQQTALELLKKMDLAAKFDWVKQGERYFSWVQFAVNPSVLNAFMNKKHPFNVLEEGLVYGFPTSAILACAGLIPKKINRQKNYANFYLSGINSEKYFDAEVKRADEIWSKMKEAAPLLIKQAEDEASSILR